MALRRTARGTGRHRVPDPPVPAYRSRQDGHRGRCRHLGRGGRHGSGRYRLAQAQRLKPSHTGAVSIAPAVDALGLGLGLAVAVALTVAVAFTLALALPFPVVLVTVIFATAVPAAIILATTIVLAAADRLVLAPADRLVLAAGARRTGIESPGAWRRAVPGARSTARSGLKGRSGLAGFTDHMPDQCVAEHERTSTARLTLLTW